jgi:hypothetical protein
MPQSQKLYQILEKAQIETKIAVEIQDWIIDTMEEKRKDSMGQFEDTKLLPMHNEMRSRFGEVDHRFEQVNRRFGEVDRRFEEVDRRFDDLEAKMDLRFNLVDEKFEMMESKIDTLRMEMNSRFNSLEKRLDATNFSIRVLGVPIVGATIGGLGVVFLTIYERLQ